MGDSVKLVTTSDWLVRELIRNAPAGVLDMKSTFVEEPVPEEILKDWTTRRKYERRKAFEARKKAMVGITLRLVPSFEFTIRPGARLMIRREGQP